MSKVDYSAKAVTERLQEASRLSDLRAENRLAYKVDMSPAAVTRRLRVVSMLRDDCLKLVRIGEANGLGRARQRRLGSAGRLPPTQVSTEPPSQ